MNIQPTAITVLCYGDSNTRGSTPTADRYSSNIRWTGLLQERLGVGYYIIEEGLGGRTTALDDLPDRPGKNGKTYLLPCLDSHNPIDIVIMMLGTNDLKERFNQTPKDISQNVEGLVKIIKERGIDRNNKPPKIILLSPPIVDETVPSTKENFKGAGEKSKQLASLYQEVAKNYGCEFIDISKIVQPSKGDGLHLEPEGHSKIARVLFELLNKSYNITTPIIQV